MATTIYRSTDGSAPVLTGTAGSLIALLDACLVNGYGSKPAAGWAKSFSGTNAASYRQGSSGFYWDVNDNAPGAALAKEARTRGYETMSALATGTGPFPTVAQSAAGVIVRKSNTADATARAWIVAADARTVYLFLATGDTAGTYLATMYGEIVSYLAGDAYKCGLMGRASENQAAAASTAEDFAILTSISGSNNGHFLARSYTQLGASVTCSKHGDVTMLSGTGLAANHGWLGNIVFPNAADGGLYMGPVRINTGTATGLRGHLRGLWYGSHAATNFADGDTFDGVGEYAGRSFLIVRSSGSASGVAAGYYIVETTTWDTSP